MKCLSQSKNLPQYLLMLLVPASSLLGLNLLSESELRISSGLSFNEFAERKVASNGTEIRVFQRYKSFAPFTQWQLTSRLAPRVQSDFKIVSSYDLEPYATNTLNDGNEVSGAHAMVVDLKYAVLYQPDPKKNFMLGIGVGAGNFGLQTDKAPIDPTTHYLHAYLPSLRAQNSYKLMGYQAQWEAELSRIDLYYFNGIGFELTHHLNVYETPHQSQGFFISFSQWSFTIPLLITHPNVKDTLRSLKFGWEVSFH
jgi:hypothetical protein